MAASVPPIVTRVGFAILAIAAIGLIVADTLWLATSRTTVEPATPLAVPARLDELRALSRAVLVPAGDVLESLDVATEAARVERAAAIVARRLQDTAREGLLSQARVAEVELRVGEHLTDALAVIAAIEESDRDRAGRIFASSQRGFDRLVAELSPTSPTIVADGTVRPSARAPPSLALVPRAVLAAVVMALCGLFWWVSHRQGREGARPWRPTNVAESPRLASSTESNRIDEFLDIIGHWRWASDGEHRLTSVGDGARECGLDPRSMVGMRWADLLDKDRATAKARAGLLANWQSRTAFRGVVIPLRSGDGAERWVKLSARPATNAEGEFTGYRGVARDVTTRRASRDRLALLESAFAQAADGIIVTEPGPLGPPYPRILFANAAMSRITGFALDEIIGKTSEIFFGPLTDRDALGRFKDPLSRGRPFRERLQCHRKDGSTYWTDRQVAPVISGGVVTNFVSVIRDVSDVVAQEIQLERQNALLQAILRAIPDGIEVIGADGHFVTGSDRLFSMYGLETPGGQGLEDPASRIGLALNDSDGRRVQAAAGGGTIEFSFANGWVECNGAVMPGGGWVVVHRDIAERKRREVELARQRDELALTRRVAEEANSAKSQFLASMSHEIRTPMNGILGMTELLLDSELSTEQRRRAGIVRECGESLLALLNDILDVSKLEVGKIELERIEFDLEELVEVAVELMAPRVAAKSIELAFNVDPRLQGGLVGDPARLRQILLNLLSNAVKFTEKGCVAIDVVADRIINGFVDIRVEVTDTGVGIDPLERQGLFRKFTQANASITRRFGGTGLGLAISRQLVELMGGSIGVESELGQGSTFWFTLSLPRATAREAEPSTPLQGLGALLVGSHDVHRRIIRRQLEGMGLVASHAADSYAAIGEIMLRRSQGEHFDLILVDGEPAGMQGDELLKRLRQASDDRSKVVHLAPTGSDRAWSGREADAVVTKPTGRRGLLAALSTVLGRGMPRTRELTPSASLTPLPSLIGAGKRILLAEDNPVNTQVAAAVLKRAGFDVDAVDDGVAAVGAAATGRYDAILMDVQMPRMDGVEATRRIRALAGRAASIPIVALTADAMVGMREHYVAQGMNDYVSKPFKREALLATLSRWIDVPAMRSEPDRRVIDDLRVQSLADRTRPEEWRTMIQRFATAVERGVRMMKTLVEREDLGSIAREASDLAEAAAAIGAIALADLSVAIEAAARSGDARSAARLINQLAECARVACEALDANARARVA